MLCNRKLPKAPVFTAIKSVHFVRYFVDWSCLKCMRQKPLTQRPNPPSAPGSLCEIPTLSELQKCQTLHYNIAPMYVYPDREVCAGCCKQIFMFTQLPIRIPAESACLSARTSFLSFHSCSEKSVLTDIRSTHRPLLALLPQPPLRILGNQPATLQMHT